MRRLAPQRVSDRWVSIALSVLLHGALLAALVYGWWLFRRPLRPAPTLAIEAQVVDARAARGALPPSQPAPPAAAPNPAPSEPPEATGPPQPTPEELAQREQAEATTEEQRIAAEKTAAEQAAVAAAAQREEEARADAERKAREAAEAQKRAEDQLHAEQQKRAEEQKHAAEQQQQDEQERAEDLKRDLAAEEQANVQRSGPARANWVAQIAAKINRAWLRPPTARAGIECTLVVTQVPGGTVTKVSIGECNGDQAVRESIEAAVYRASPLPPPPDPAMFDPVLHIDFKPD